jgi:dGTPase
MQVTDLIQETEKRITKLKLKSCAQAKRLDNKIVSFSKSMQDLRKPLRTFLMENLYHHYRVIRMSNKAKRFIQELFKIYITNPKQLPPHIQKNIPADGTRRVICDYIAGMTDRYALDEYKKLFDPYEKV